MERLEEIIEGCVAGDSRAQEELYKMFAPGMFGLCQRYARDKSEAEDNLQEGFIKVFTHIKNFRHEGSLEGWIKRIMINVSLEKHRKHHLLHPVEDMRIFESENLSDGIMDKIAADELVTLIQNLPPRYRMVFNLYVMEGYNHQEISEEMRISVGTSKSNLARARDILKQKIQNQFNLMGTNTHFSA